MGQMNKIVDPQAVAKTMQEFEMANAKMEMTEETSKLKFIYSEKATNFWKDSPLDLTFTVFFLAFL